jgi:hypothetical protein
VVVTDLAMKDVRHDRYELFPQNVGIECRQLCLAAREEFECVGTLPGGGKCCQAFAAASATIIS